MKLTNLFEPGNIGSMHVRNRIVMPPMQTRGADERGFVTERLIDYYAARAKGGAGFIIVQQSFAWPGAQLTRGIALWDDSYIQGLSNLARGIQKYGAKAVIQIGCRGTLQDKGMESIAPSPVPISSHKDIPRELTQKEIFSYIEAIAQSAVLICKAGFDALEIHGAHGHLISQFLSPYTNRRSDEFGGSIENRARFACLILNRVRENVGPNFPILFRMNGDDFIEGGLTIEEAIEQAGMLVRAGADALHVSGSCHETIWQHFPPYLYPSGNLVHLAMQIKKAVDVPIITVGKIGDPLIAEQILAEGNADFVAMGRALIADPDLPNKARDGLLDEIRRCLYCCNCLMWEQSPRLRNRGISCTVNPGVLREAEFTLRKSARKKRVMVIGGGLAGMEAARTLAERGHEVTLCERDSQLGGQWSMAAHSECKEDYKTLIPFLTRGLEKAGVKVCLNTDVSVPLVLAEKPDAVVLATGAVPKSMKMDFPGMKGPAVVQAIEVLTRKTNVGNRIVVVGGGSLGMEVAALLARQGRHVSLVETRELGYRLPQGIRATLRNRLVEEGVFLYPHSTIMRITPTGVDVANDGMFLHLKADTVVLAIGAHPANELFEALQGKGIDIYAIGDCVRARNAMEAISEGAEIGRII